MSSEAFQVWLSQGWVPYWDPERIGGPAQATAGRLSPPISWSARRAWKKERSPALCRFYLRKLDRPWRPKPSFAAVAARCNQSLGGRFACFFDAPRTPRFTALSCPWQCRARAV